MKSFKKILNFMIILCLTAAMLPAQLLVFAENSFPEGYTIYPKPHSIQYDAGGVNLENVNLVVSENADMPTMLRIEKILSESGVVFEKSEEITSGKTNILLGIANEDNAITDYFGGLQLSNTAALSELDGYILNVAGGNIMVMGRDAISLFYGVVTLEQILAEGTSVRNMLINDFSDTVNRGTIEGFYGIPWSFEGRKAVIEMSGKYKMNQYIYAPKDDPYHHGALWREPYPAEDLADLKTLVDTANENNVEFIWAVHVNDTFDLTDADDAENLLLAEGGTHASSGGQWWEQDRGKLVPVGQHSVDTYDAEETYQSVLAKYEQLYSIGVRQFGFFADDISFPLIRYHAPYLVEFVNRLNREFIQAKGDLKPLIFCPTYYHRGDIAFNGRPYMETIGALDASIEIMYTGQNVMSDIRAGNSSSYNGYFTSLMGGRKPFIWWNYPVSDYAPQYIFLGPTPGLYPDAKGTMTGAVSNPMQQSFASHISLFGMADFLWNTAGYNRDQNWADSFEWLYPEVAESLKQISTHAISGYNTASMENMSGKESAYLVPLMNSFTNAIANGDVDAAGSALRPEFVKLLDAIVDFRENCASEGLKEDLQPWVDKLESLCLTGIQTIDSFMADDTETAWTAYSAASAEMATWPSITVPQLAGGRVAAEIGSVALTKFVTNAIDKLESSLSGGQSGDQLTKTNTMITNITGLASQTVSKSDNTYTLGALSDVSLAPDRYIGIKLDNVYKADEIKAAFGGIDIFEHSLNFQYSVNGQEWLNINQVVEDNELSTDLDGASARYFRIINQNTETVAFDLLSFSINVTGGTKVSPASVSSTAGIYQSYRATNLFDGNYTSTYWTNGNQVPGQEVVATFAAPFKLYDFALYEATGDYIRNGSIYTSIDNENWTKAGSVGTNFVSERIGNETYYVIRGNAGGIETKYIKIATESTANVWTKLHEFEFNKTTGEADGTIPAFSAVMDGTPSNLVDGDYSTVFTTASGEPYLDYMVSENANATSVVVLQNSLNISNAKVSVKMSEGNEYFWQEIGTLSAAYNEFDLSEYSYGISDIRFEWTENDVVPRIHEIYTNTVIDKTGLMEAIALGKATEPTDVVYGYEELQAAIYYAEAVADDPLASKGAVGIATTMIYSWIATLENSYAIDKTIDDEKMTVNITNYTGADKDMIVIVAVYNANGSLATTKAVNKTMAPGENEAMSFDEIEAYEGYGFKIFAWDPETFVPLCPWGHGTF